ncbi:zinc finger protein 37-like [Ruditapes philippinarum]|uniref:zinc finger protein 37-like n=1 Tax=Ruditapes philippinarum TaxID=129788 RepID=UPI00295AE902|nr:zinc finger protein 37-like [Ruditapes philippinarum]
MENVGNIESDLIEDGIESEQNCLIESIPQTFEPVLFLHQDTSLSPQVQQSKLNSSNIQGPDQLLQSVTTDQLPVQIQKSNFELDTDKNVSPNSLGEDVKKSHIYVTSSVSNVPKLQDVKIVKSTKEIAVLKQFSNFRDTVGPSTKVSDICLNTSEHVQRTLSPKNDDLDNVKDGSKQLKYTNNTKHIDYNKNSPISNATQVKDNSGSECMTTKVSIENYLASNHMVTNNICEIRNVINSTETGENDSKKCDKMDINSGEIGIIVTDVSEEVTVTPKSKHICMEKESITCATYICGSCKIRFVTLCKLHDHFEKQHHTGSYTYLQKTKTGFPRLENVSKFTQTDVAYLLEVDQSHFKNDEVVDIDGNHLEAGFDTICNKNTVKLAGTEEIEINNEDSSETSKVKKSKERRKKKKLKYKSGKMELDRKFVTNTKENPSYKIYVHKENIAQIDSRNHKESKPDKKISDDNKHLENVNNLTETMETDGIENDDGQSELTFSDNKNVTFEIEETSDAQENFTSINDTEDSKTSKYREIIHQSQLKWKQNQTPKNKAPHKNTKGIDKDENSINNRCNICATKYVSKVKLQYHMRKVHKKTTIDSEKQCRWCGMTFPGSKSCASHMRQCEKNEFLMCLICTTRFDSRNEVTDHLLNHRNENELKCRVCERTFTSPLSLQNHLRRHNLRRDLQCEHCGKSFYYHNRLKKHKLHCNREPEIECEHCAVKFKTEESLKHHMSVHSNDRPFVCHVCGYAAKKSMYLKRHLRRHTGERPYVCTDCGMSFAAASGLNRHRKTHTNEKLYVCQYCGKSFTNNWNLKTHLRQHTGDTPYQCMQCGKAFKQNVLLKLHAKSHHPVGSVLD